MPHPDFNTGPPPSRSEERYRRLAELSRDAVFCLSPDLTIVSLNPAFDVLTGRPRSEWIGKSWLDLVHPDDQALVVGCLHRTMQGEARVACEIRLRRETGDGVVVELSFAAEYENGHVAGLLGIARDMAGRPQGGEPETPRYAELVHSHKMEAIGRLAGGIAHDFNNLLTIITGYSQLLLSRLRQDDGLRGDIEEIRKAADRAASLTQQLLAFSRRQVMVPKVLNLNMIVGTVDTMLQRLIGEHIQMITVLDPSLGHVKADPGQMEQVIMNLAVNGRDAMPKGGKLTIESMNVNVASRRLLREGSLLPGRYAKLSVTDTGSGMDLETQARIFEPFFTTKAQGQGTGLGLATVYGIIKQSDGHLLVESEPGRGTVFHIYLPIVEQPLEAGEPDKSGATLPYGTETVLLVEDEPAVRMLIRDTLRLFGYTVLEARHGFEAELIGSQRADRIDLLMTDVVMPQMGGKELADGLMRIHPGIKVLYMSGYTENAMLDHGMGSGANFLQKPFTPDMLAQKVREILNSPP